MNGIMIVIILVGTFLVAVGVDMWLYREEKPHFLWRLVPAVLYIGANEYVYWRFGFNVFWLRNMWMLTLFLISTTEDIRKKELPLDFYLVFAIPAILLHIIQADWLNPLVAAILYVIFYGVARFSKEAIGYGDAVVIPLLCLLGGYQTAGVIVLLALVLVGIIGLVMLVSRKANRKTEVPFVPFLALAYFIYLWF